MKSVITNSLDNKAAPFVKMTNVKMTYRFSARVAQVSS